MKNWLTLQDDTVNAHKFLKQISWAEAFGLKADSGLNYLIAALPDTSKQIFNQQKVRRYLIVEEQNLKVTQGYEVQFSVYLGQTLSKVNIEFEAAVLRDMTNKTTEALEHATAEDQLAYKDWLSSITNSNTSFPQSINDIMPNATAKELYFHIMDLYNDQYGMDRPIMVLLIVTLILWLYLK